MSSVGDAGPPVPDSGDLPAKSGTGDYVEIGVDCHCRGERTFVKASARGVGAELVCHPMITWGSELSLQDWGITHRRTGRRVTPGRFHSRADALRFIDIITPLADWRSASANTSAGWTGAEAERVQHTVELAYEHFVPTTPEPRVTEPVSR